MNSNKKWSKSISVALLVVLASIATSGLVLADHFPPVASVTINSLRSFEQYQAAIEHAEQDRAAVEASLKTRGDARSQNHLPYLDEFDQTGLEKNVAPVTSRTSDAASSMLSEEQVKLISELTSNQAFVISHINDAEDSLQSWEQYFKYAR